MLVLPKLIIETDNISKIKDLKPQNKQKGGKYHQGYYDRTKALKYAGNDKIIFRSSLEFKFIEWCEKNSDVVMWSSECGYTPYFFENRMRRYFIDFVFVDKSNNVFYVEIKPKSFVLEAKLLRNNMNAEKWRAIMKLCNANDGHYFKIITEDFFNVNKKG